MRLDLAQLCAAWPRVFAAPRCDFGEGAGSVCRLLSAVHLTDFPAVAGKAAAGSFFAQSLRNSLFSCVNFKPADAESHPGDGVELRRFWGVGRGRSTMD